MPHTLRKFGIPPKYRLLAVLSGAAILLLLLLCPHRVASNTGLAACLTEKGVVMYGSDSCESCRKQKKTFGEDFKDVNYVNCEFSHEECAKKNISVYPVWAFDGRVLIGSQTLDALAEFAGCGNPDQNQ